MQGSPRKVTARRKERGLTLMETAQAAGVPVWDVLMFERGAIVHRGVAAKLAAALLRLPAIPAPKGSHALLS